MTVSCLLVGQTQAKVRQTMVSVALGPGSMNSR